MAAKKLIEAPSKWKCELCGNKVTVHVPLEYPPYCQSEKHKSKVPDMVRAERKRAAG